tara:strand:- start:7102 stop:8217 length:1116 start_codon:yes stop_codon:yes gene_type:complete
MKTKFLILLITLFGINSFSQITVDESHISNIGDVVYRYTEAPTGSYNVGAAGTNHVWDFSGVWQQSNVAPLFFIDPTGSPFDLQYPNTNLCLNDNGTYSYYNKTSTGLFLHGLGDTVFNSPALYLPLPLTYGLSLTDGPVVVIQDAVYGPFLAPYIPNALVAQLTNGLANKADTALIKITSTTDFEVDNWGSMTTDLGTFDVLRLKLITYTDSELDVYCSDTITGIGSWIVNVPFDSIPALSTFSNNDIEYKYQWITDDNSASFLICEAFVDANDNITAWAFQAPVPPSNLITLDPEQFKIYPIPATNSLTIENQERVITDLRLTDIQGKVILESQFNTTMNLSLEGIARGVYYLNLNTEQGGLTKKVSVH